MNSLIKIGEGKSKNIYLEKNSKDFLYLEFKGDIRCSKYVTAYNKMVADLRAKTSYHIFQYLGKVIPNIAYTELVDSNIIKIQNCEPISLEWIPRFVAAGSVVKRFGFQQGYQFKKPVLKIDYKTEDEDYLINDDLIVEKNLLTYDELLQAKTLSINVAKQLKLLFDDKGLDLWDFKLELGKSTDGSIILIDEISFDGMRLKDKKTGESFDKDVYRQTGNITMVTNAYKKGFIRIFGDEI